VTEAVARAADLARLGHRRPITTDEITAALRAAEGDPDPRVRAAALGALVRASPEHARSAWTAAGADRDSSVRRRAAEVAPRLPAGEVAPVLVPLLDDPDVTVVEAAAWALGECFDDAETVSIEVVGTLARVVVEHRDPLAREAAVAALGALGDARGLDAILTACADRPSVRRRAVLALAPFDGPRVEAAIAAAHADKDWQVRQVADDLLGAHEPADASEPPGQS
jgi:HEAT repeat protein